MELIGPAGELKGCGQSRLVIRVGWVVVVGGGGGG